MRHWLVVTTQILTVSTLTQPLHKQPYQPPAASPDIFSAVFGSGLASVLLVLVTLILLGVLSWIARMFLSGQWVTAKYGAARISQKPSQNTSMPSFHPMQNRNLQLSMPAPDLQRSSAVASSDGSFGRRGLDRMEDPPGIESPLKNTRWLGLVKGCVALFDELDGLFPATDQRREAAQHVMLRLQEILGRSGVEIISNDHTYDIYRHQLEPPGTTAAQGTPITKILSPGFAIGRAVLRPARVRIASSSSEHAESGR